MAPGAPPKCTLLRKWKGSRVVISRKNACLVKGCPQYYVNGRHSCAPHWYAFHSLACFVCFFHDKLVCVPLSRMLLRALESFCTPNWYAFHSLACCVCCRTARRAQKSRQNGGFLSKWGPHGLASRMSHSLLFSDFVYAFLIGFVF